MFPSVGTKVAVLWPQRFVLATQLASTWTQERVVRQITNTGVSRLGKHGFKVGLIIVAKIRRRLRCRDYDEKWPPKAFPVFGVLFLCLLYLLSTAILSLYLSSTFVESTQKITASVVSLRVGTSLRLGTQATTNNGDFQWAYARPDQDGPRSHNLRIIFRGLWSYQQVVISSAGHHHCWRRFVS